MPYISYRFVLFIYLVFKYKYIYIFLILIYHKIYFNNGLTFSIRFVCCSTKMLQNVHDHNIPNLFNLK